MRKIIKLKPDSISYKKQRKRYQSKFIMQNLCIVCETTSSEDVVAHQHFVFTYHPVTIPIGRTNKVLSLFQGVLFVARVEVRHHFITVHKIVSVGIHVFFELTAFSVTQHKNRSFESVRDYKIILRIPRK